MTENISHTPYRWLFCRVPVYTPTQLLSVCQLNYPWKNYGLENNKRVSSAMAPNDLANPYKRIAVKETEEWICIVNRLQSISMTISSEGTRVAAKNHNTQNMLRLLVLLLTTTYKDENNNNRASYCSVPRLYYSTTQRVVLAELPINIPEEWNIRPRERELTRIRRVVSWLPKETFDWEGGGGCGWPSSGVESALRSAGWIGSSSSSGIIIIRTLLPSNEP